MKLHDLLDPTDLETAIRDRLVKVRTAADGQRIYNYSDLAVYTAGAWDSPAVRQCRGLIVDKDDTVVARPWAKFFNYGQPQAGSLDLGAEVEVTDKMDGSLGILHRDEAGEPRIATRGSFDSTQAEHATSLLRSRYPGLWWPASLTLLFEIVYPQNRIVCDYDDLDDLVLLGAVNIDTGRYIGPRSAATLSTWLGPVTETFVYSTLAQALAAPPRKGAEGLCVRSVETSHIVKIKQDDYVALHRIVTGLSERTVWDALVAEKQVTDLLHGLPDELHPWVREVWDRIDGAATAKVERAKTVFDGITERADRRAFAAQATTHGPLAPYLFLLLDGRDVRRLALNACRPVGPTFAKQVDEDAA